MTRYLLLILIGCGTDPSSGDDGSCMMGATEACTCANGGMGVQICDGTGAFGACGMCAPPDPDPTRVNFQAEIVPIIERSCGPSNGACHVRDMYGANVNMSCRGWLTLENAS